MFSRKTKQVRSQIPKPRSAAPGQKPLRTPPAFVRMHKTADEADTQEGAYMDTFESVVGAVQPLFPPNEPEPEINAAPRPNSVTETYELYVKGILEEFNRDLAENAFGGNEAAGITDNVFMRELKKLGVNLDIDLPMSEFLTDRSGKPGSLYEIAGIVNAAREPVICKIDSLLRELCLNLDDPFISNKALYAVQSIRNSRGQGKDLQLISAMIAKEERMIYSRTFDNPAMRRCGHADGSVV